MEWRGSDDEGEGIVDNGNDERGESVGMDVE